MTPEEMKIWHQQQTALSMTQQSVGRGYRKTTQAVEVLDIRGKDLQEAWDEGSAERTDYMLIQEQLIANKQLLADMHELDDEDE
jgi:hypothetical protein